MFHHDGRDYKQAASEAAKRGRVKMEEIIQAGLASAASVIEDVQAKVVTDQVVRAPKVMVFHDRECEDWMLSVPDHPAGELHKNAYGQVLENVGLPKKYANDLEENRTDGGRWGKELIAHNINTVLMHRVEQRNLVRRENDVVKGFLSDKYRRLDSRPLLDAFIGQCQAGGLVPIQGIASDTKCRVRAVLPKVFEPADNEVMLFGLEWGNSDFGDGGHVVNLWAMRVWCTNLAITDRCLRQIHLGARLADDIAYSEKTYRLDTETNASALKDVVKDAIGPGRVNAMLEVIKAASEHEIKGRDGIDAILKKHLDKADVERVKALYESHDEVNMPKGNTVWRLSNAVSWLAQAKEFSADKKLELEAVAGALIPHKAVNAVAV